MWPFSTQKTMKTQLFSNLSSKLIKSFSFIRQEKKNIESKTKHEIYLTYASGTSFHSDDGVSMCRLYAAIIRIKTSYEDKPLSNYFFSTPNDITGNENDALRPTTLIAAQKQ